MDKYRVYLVLAKTMESEEGIFFCTIKNEVRKCQSRNVTFIVEGADNLSNCFNPQEVKSFTITKIDE